MGLKLFVDSSVFLDSAPSQRQIALHANCLSSKHSGDATTRKNRITYFHYAHVIFMTELLSLAKSIKEPQHLYCQTKCLYTAAAEIYSSPLCTCAVIICICNVGKTISTQRRLRWVHGGSGMEEGWAMRSSLNEIS